MSGTRRGVAGPRDSDFPKLRATFRTPRAAHGTLGSDDPMHRASSVQVVASMHSSSSQLVLYRRGSPSPCMVALPRNENGPGPGRWYYSLGDVPLDGVFTRVVASLRVSFHSPPPFPVSTHHRRRRPPLPLPPLPVPLPVPSPTSTSFCCFLLTHSSIHRRRRRHLTTRCLKSTTGDLFPPYPPPLLGQLHSTGTYPTHHVQQHALSIHSSGKHLPLFLQPNPPLILHLSIHTHPLPLLRIRPRLFLARRNVGTIRTRTLPGPRSRVLAQPPRRLLGQQLWQRRRRLPRRL